MSEKKISHTASKKTKEPVDDSKSKRLDAVLDDIDKTYGKGSIMHADGVAVKNIEFVSTGIPGVDVALGCGGLPLGRIIEVFGEESSGKTTLTLHAAAEVQKANGTVAFVDAEHALDQTYARKLGVRMDKLLLSQPDSGEQALSITLKLVESHAVDLIVIDSVAALVPQAELDGDMGKAHMGLQARLMSQALRKLTGALSKSNCIIIFINQLRSKIGVIYGSNKVTTGGNALKFYASVRIDISRQNKINEGESTIGSETRVKVTKNKVAPPFKEVKFQVYFGKGIDKASSLIDLAVEYDIIKKAGAYYSYGEERLGHGKPNTAAFLKGNDKLYNDIKKQVFKACDIPLAAHKYKK